MDVMTALNGQYAEMCKKLGDIEIQLLILSDKKKQLIAQIEALNNIAPAIKSLITPAVQDEKKN